jgi:hypothetical protein
MTLRGELSQWRGEARPPEVAHVSHVHFAEVPEVMVAHEQSCGLVHPREVQVAPVERVTRIGREGRVTGERNNGRCERWR